MDIPEHLLPTQFQRADIVRTIRCVMVKPGTTLEMVLEPDFWVHAGGPSGSLNAIRINDKIEVIAQDGSFEAELRCVATDTRGYWAQMRLLNKWPAELTLTAKHREENGRKSAAPKTWPDTEGYRVEHNPVHKWRIIDRVGQIIAKGYADEADAIRALAIIKGEKVAA